jgi:hypothetical protein
MEYNTKNYTEQGGEKTVIGGTLEIKEGASITGLPSTPVEIPAATADALGGVIAAEKGAGDTVEAKIGSDNKLYVPTYPVVPEQPVAATQADSTAADAAALVVDFNALLAKLKAAGLMATE